MSDNILEERAKDWGDPLRSHARIGEMWGAILRYPVDAYDVALMMAALKLVRADLNPDNPDSLIDAKGYLTIAQRIVEEQQGE